MITAMDVDHPEKDQHWDRRERGETEVERLDRNWNSLLLLGFALTGTTGVIFAAASGYKAVFAAGACALVLFVLFWLVVPLLLRNRVTAR
jgi:hypothetical protein